MFQPDFRYLKVQNRFKNLSSIREFPQVSGSFLENKISNLKNLSFRKTPGYFVRGPKLPGSSGSRNIQVFKTSPHVRRLQPPPLLPPFHVPLIHSPVRLSTKSAAQVFPARRTRSPSDARHLRIHLQPHSN